VFLDEIGEMTAGLQAKLLRFWRKRHSSASAALATFASMSA
jgi:transcriptional regulator with PAS, ATPase and Fis domain